MKEKEPQDGALLACYKGEYSFRFDEPPVREVSDTRRGLGYLL
jgi:hypothetical protein